MNERALIAELQIVADQGLIRTNPVWCMDQLLARWEGRDEYWVALPHSLGRVITALAQVGINFPRNALERWGVQLSDSEQDLAKEPKPGVVGLVVDRLCDEGLVLPLSVKRTDEWSIDPSLPFRDVVGFQLLCLQLLRALHLPNSDGVPERFAYTFGDPLGRRSDGASMHVAGMLAIVRAENNDPSALDRACSVVQPDQEHLVPVSGIRPKLDAFLREYETGTLLIRAKGCQEAKAYCEHFEEVWEVTSLEDLAKELESRGWLKVFLTHQRLTKAEATTVANKARRLEVEEHRYQDALNLVARAERCEFAPDVPMRIRREFRQQQIDLHRHLGAYQQSANLADEFSRELRDSVASSYDDLAEADVNRASALYSPHNFEGMVSLLEPWRNHLTEDPFQVKAVTRLKVFNTLGRALVALEQDGWEDLFFWSEKLLEELEPSDLPRTWSYRAQGYLRAGRLEEAEEVLQRIENHPGLGDMSRWFLRFWQADAARRRGRIWEDQEMEQATVSRRVGHPFAFYFQATARQPGREIADSVERFRRAREFFGQDRPGSQDEQNIQCFLTDCICLAEAAWQNNQQSWDDTLGRLENQLVPTTSFTLHEHYKGCLPSKGSDPDRETVEKLLVKVPFF
ncbi:MAG: hypothetical protein ACFCD0_27305 [Gemmataceae bacterium]